jgi:hypothetical protein
MVVIRDTISFIVAFLGFLFNRTETGYNQRITIGTIEAFETIYALKIVDFGTKKPREDMWMIEAAARINRFERRPNPKFLPREASLHPAGG